MSKYIRVEICISRSFSGPNGPFILHPRFLQFLEIWFEKSGLRNLVREIWFKKSGSRKMVFQTWIFFLVREKWLTRKKGGFIP